MYDYNVGTKRIIQSLISKHDALASDPRAATLRQGFGLPERASAGSGSRPERERFFRRPEGRDGGEESLGSEARLPIYLPRSRAPKASRI